MPSAQEPKTKGNLPRSSAATRSGDAIRVSAKDGESYADILKAMKVKVNSQNAVAEVLSIRRTRREEVLLILKKGGDVSTIEIARASGSGSCPIFRAELRRLRGGK